MILHLVTDRRRLSTFNTETDRTACLLAQARYAVDAGIDAIQVREPDLDGGALARLVALVVAATRGTSTRVIVNDRLDVALAAGADGVHLRGSSFGADTVRPRVPAGFVIGRSVHSATEARGAGPVDYLIAGTVWQTASKPAEHTLLGLDGLRLVAAASQVPVLAIGGVSLDRARLVADAGAQGAAAIGAFTGGNAPCRAQSLSELVQAYRMRFGGC